MAKSFPNTGATVGLAADRTAMTSMVEGQEFFETDTNKMFVYSGSGWVQTNSWSTTSGVTGVSNLIVPPMARIARTSNLTSYLGTAIPYETEVFDTDSMVDLATDATKMTVNTAGVYSIFYRARLSGAATITRATLELYVNGAYLAGEDTFISSSTSAGLGSLNTMLSLSVNDVITTHVAPGGGSAYVIAGNATENFSRATLQLTWVGNTS